MNPLEIKENIVLVSVIIPTYNRANCLKRAIDSVLNQSITNWELLIIDNNSKDDTESVIKSYFDPRIKFFKINNHGVIAASRNKGIRSAKGKYLAFLDSDDWWTPEKLEKSIESLEAGADFIYHDLYIVPPSIFRSKKIKSRQVVQPVFKDLLINGSAICNSSVVIRRELMEQIKGFSEDSKLVAAEDYEAWLRISKIVEKFKRLPECLGYYSVGLDNVSSPEHTIMNIKRILKLYRFEIQQECSYMPGWMNYSLASSYFKKKLYKRSKLYALRTFNRCPSLKLQARSVAILILLFLRSFFNNFR